MSCDAPVVQSSQGTSRSSNRRSKMSTGDRNGSSVRLNQRLTVVFPVKLGSCRCRSQTSVVTPTFLPRKSFDVNGSQNVFRFFYGSQVQFLYSSTPKTLPGCPGGSVRNGDSDPMSTQSKSGLFQNFKKITQCCSYSVLRNASLYLKV